MPRAATSKSYWNENNIWRSAVSCLIGRFIEGAQRLERAGLHLLSPCCSGAPGYELMQKTRALQGQISTSLRGCLKPLLSLPGQFWQQEVSQISRASCACSPSAVHSQHSRLRKSSMDLVSSMSAATREPWAGWLWHWGSSQHLPARAAWQRGRTTELQANMTDTGSKIHTATITRASGSGW